MLAIENDTKSVHSEGDGSKRKVLLVANVAKEHVLKFHVPTIKLLKESGWHIDVACAGQETIPFCNSQFVMSYKRSPFNLSLFKGINELKKIIDKNEYDIVYCHTPVGALAARIASLKARKRGTQVIYMAHGFHFFTGAPLKNWLLFYPVEKILSHVTDSLILINQEDYQRAKKQFHQRSTYMLNGIGVDLSRFQQNDIASIRQSYRDELGIPQNAIVLIYLAELIPNKNQPFLMRVLKRLMNNNENVYLVLAGVDHTNGSFVKYAEDIGISEHVRYLGWRTDVANLYAMADICTATSMREGLATNIIEAMASGLPVVATDNRGHRAIIQDGKNGFLIQQKNEELYVKRIEELIINDQLRKLIVGNAKKDLDKYSIVVATKRIRSILEEHL